MKTRSEKKTGGNHEPLLHDAVQFRFALFLQHYPPKEFSRNLRSMLVDYMTFQLENTSINVTHNLLTGMEELFRVLDKAEDKWQERDVMDLYELVNEEDTE